MTGYINTLIVTMIVSQLAIILAPSKESARKYIKLICALAILMCIISPIGSIIQNANDFCIEVKTLFDMNVREEPTDAEYRSSATVLLNYITANFEISEKNITISFITDDTTGEPIQVQIYIKYCDKVTADLIETTLSRELMIPAYVFIEE